MNVCKLAYEYLQKHDLLFSIQDEIENPNKADAINQLEILARRGYFSIPTYDFEQEYDNVISKNMILFMLNPHLKKMQKNLTLLKCLKMSKWCFNYDSGKYEDIDKDGFSYTRGEYVYNWDDSDYRREEEEIERQEEEDWQLTLFFYIKNFAIYSPNLM